jgi:hypothetical protein
MFMGDQSRDRHYIHGHFICFEIQLLRFNVGLLECISCGGLHVLCMYSIGRVKASSLNLPDWFRIVKSSSLSEGNLCSAFFETESPPLQRLGSRSIPLGGEEIFCISRHFHYEILAAPTDFSGRG